MRIVYLEDNDLWQKKIKKYLLDVQFKLEIDLELICCKKLNELYKYDDIQLFILDIEVDNSNAIDEYTNLMNNYNSSLIVYLTNHNTYMKQAFALNVIKFIEKKDYKELEDVIRFANSYFSRKGQKLKTDEGSQFFVYNDILYLESFGKKIYLYTEFGEFRLYEYGIKHLEKQLPTQFILIDKQVIVNLDKVFLLTKEKLVLKGCNTNFIVSRRKYKNVCETFLRRSKERSNEFFR